MSDETRVCPGYDCDRPLRDEFLCRRCQHRAERALGDLPALARQLEITVARQDRVFRAGAARGRVQDEDWRGSEHALPVTAWPADVGTAERGRVVFELLFEWADFVATRHNMRGLPVFAAHMPLTELVPQAVAILLRNTEWLRNDEQGPALADAIHSVRRDMRRLVDQRPERLYAGPCDADLDYPPELGYKCRLPLFRAWGADTITCDGYRPNTKPGEWLSAGCGHVHDVDTDRKEWLTATVSEQLLPLPLMLDMVAALHPNVSAETAKQWTTERRSRVKTKTKNGKVRHRIHITPPRLEPAGWAGDIPLYRGADVLRLAKDDQPRRGRRRVSRVA